MTTRTYHDIFGAVLERRSVRAFLPRPVDRSLVEDLLRVTIWAPSPHNTQPWRFTVLFEAEDKDRLARAMGERLRQELEADAMDAQTMGRQVARSHQRVTGAPVVILCCLSADGLVGYPDERRNQLEWEMAVQSVGAALQTLFLLAGTHGLGSCWMAAPMYCPEEVREALQLPLEWVPQALALLGYPASPGKVRARRPFAEVVDLR